ncbi:MAG: phospholipid carrier-dependent glycosyltransferase [Hominenteromicrobium sp.]
MTLQILISAAFLCAVLWLGFRVPAEDPQERPRRTLFGLPPVPVFCAVLAAGLVLRLVLGYSINGFDADISCFKSWAMYTHEYGFSEMYYSDFFIDYPPGYLYILYLTEFFRRLFFIPQYAQASTLLIKMAPILSDIGCAAILWVLARKKLGESSAQFVSAAYLFCPAVILNSAVWGQADSFCALLLLLTLLLLWYNHTPAAAMLYGLGVLSKPQMLIFAPVLIFWVIRRRDWKNLILGPVLALGVILLLSTPFIKDWDYGKLIEIYTGTIDYYAYYTINAYNLWALLGRNWAALPENSLWLQFGVPLAVVLAGILMLKSRHREAVFACPTVLMFTVYIFCVKMHERYLFPVLLCLLLTYVFTREKRFLLCFAGTSFFHFLNVAYVLYLNNSYIEPTAPQIILLSLAHLVMYGYMLYATWRVFLSNRAPKPLTRPQRAPQKRTAHGTAPRRTAPAQPAALVTDLNRDVRLSRTDILLLCAVTLAYALVAFWNLGDRQTANTTWTPANGESVIFSTTDAYSEIYYLPGIAAADNGIGQRVGTSMRIEVSDDGESWAVAAEDTDGSVYAWQSVTAYATGKYIRITATCDDLAINEIAFKKADGTGFATLTAVRGDAWQLSDEQNVVPLWPSYMNSTYFDEIYHARTAYEHILGLEPYENTHPPLGKLIISLGIRMFGMNPFGWRFMGTLFGVLMLPVLYHFLKRLFGSTFLCAVGTTLFAFDFMHYVQTRIATIDTYAVFFILLMYDAMLVFLQTDLMTSPRRKILLPLFFSGLFMGLGIASKWTVAYGACGLAVLFFGKLVFTCRALNLRTLPAKRRDEAQAVFRRRALLTCLWCCLFFLLIPFAVYFAAFLPLTTLAHNRYDVFGRFISYQVHMYNYHSTLQATHTFESPWYQWPFDIRNVWYYGNYHADANDSIRTISVLGSPLFWWACVPAMLYTFVRAVKKHSRPALVAAVGFLSVYLPWVLVPRCTFVYHYFTAVPFLLLAFLIAYRRLAEAPRMARPVLACTVRGTAVTLTAAQLSLLIFTAVHLVLFAVFYPVLTGTLTTQAYANALEWLPTWFFI